MMNEMNQRLMRSMQQQKQQPRRRIYPLDYCLACYMLRVVYEPLLHDMHTRRTAGMSTSPAKPKKLSEAEMQMASKLFSPEYEQQAATISLSDLDNKPHDGLMRGTTQTP